MVDLQRCLAKLSKRAPASEAEVWRAEAQLGSKLPVAYVNFLRTANGAEGFIGERAYTIFWPVSDLKPMNEAYEVQDYAPGLLLFASDGGGEAFGFDTRDLDWSIVRVPFVGMSWELARDMGTSFIEFLKRLCGETG